jgi:hypothetical protein
MKELPNGIANFGILVKRNCIYADKTRLLYDLVRIEKPYFLSRPRRFGKTLLVSALEAILRGQRELFKGLWIDGSDYDWEPNPVIRLSLDGLESESVERLESGLTSRIRDIAESESLSLIGSYPVELFQSLFGKLYTKYGRKVAVLIDEYDTPILRQIENSSLADKIRTKLQSFFICLKTKEEERGFTFITGVSKFAQTSIFSALNNLVDLTLNRDYADICGFTLAEFDALFSDRMEGTLKSLKADGFFGPEAQIANLRDTILQWYDGYSWDGKSRVLNPWSIINFFYNRAFRDYWTQTASRPSFLVSLVKSGKININSLYAEKSITDSLNVIELGAELEPIPLLFQAGYLTVARVDRSTDEYFLDYPNLEVSLGVIPLLMSMKPIVNPLKRSKKCVAMFHSLTQLDTAGFQKSFSEFLAELPYEIHENDLKFHEAYYHMIFFLASKMADKIIVNEVSVAEGRFDSYYQAPDGTHFIIELKHCPWKEKGDDTKITYSDAQIKKMSENMENKAAEAMRQIETRNYAQAYRGLGQPIYKVALVVGGRSRVLAVIKRDEDA